MYPHNTKLIDGKPSKYHPYYRTWKGMRERCSNKNHKDFSIYGGKGVRVCDRWNSFQNFVIDMGIRPDGYTLDRINGDGHYEPSNCRWADLKTQAKNQKKRKTGFKKGAYKNSTTGIKGVYNLPNGKFRAVIHENGKNKHIGCFDNVESAIQSLKRA